MKDIHPLQIERAYRVSTAPSEEAMTALVRVLRTPELGMTVIGKWRFGKTTFVDIVEERFTAARSAVVMKSTMVHDRSDAWLNKFYRRLRGEEESGEVGVARQPQLALHRHVYNECDKLGTRLVIFPLDEAQNMPLAQLNQLKTLSANLHGMGLKAFFLLVGQPELLYLVELAKYHQRQDLVQRYLLRQHHFRGLRSAAELRTFLAHTDSAVWPLDSGITYTQHFAPEAWKRGWRISGEAEAMWNAFKSLAEAIQLSPDRLELGLTYAAQAQLELLREISIQKDCPVNVRGELRGGNGLHLAAAKWSGFTVSQRSTNPPSTNEAERLQQARRWRPGESGRV